MATAVCLAGCAPKEPAPFPVYSKAEKPYVPSPESRNAYDAYVLAAKRAAELVPETERRRNYTAGFKLKTVTTLGPVLDSVSRATNSDCEFHYEARSPFAGTTTGKDWFLIGRAIAWHVESLLESGEAEKAVDWTLVGVRFGCDLSKGDVEDCTVGYSIVELVREAAHSRPDALNPARLSRLSDGITAALARAGDAEAVLDNQEKAMLAAVQSVQDMYKAHDTSKLEALLYKDSRDAVAYLKNLKEADRPGYFDGFASEAKSVAHYCLMESKKTASQRIALAYPDKQSRPWKRFSQHFFAPAIAYLDMHDRFLAMTRLWAVDSRCRAAALRGKAPESIADLGPVALDPYSGKNFVYYAAGADFKVYSVGKDGRDDGGHSDDGYQPDMVPLGKL